MEYLIPVSLSVGVFSIILALVSIWLSVTYSRDAQRMLNDTRELVKGLSSRIGDVEKNTREQGEKMLSHIIDLSRKDVPSTDLPQIAQMLEQIQGTALEDVFRKYLERGLEKGEKE